jgi:negative regulator of flagellin synthesis FlgM
MEINGKNLLAGLNVDRLDYDPRQKRVESSDRDSIPAGSDRIELSVRGREIQHLDQLIQSTPDVREARIEEVRSALEAGTYNVKAEKIADKIIGGGLIDKIF